MLWSASTDALTSVSRRPPVTPEQACIVNEGLEAALGHENDVVAQRAHRRRTHRLPRSDRNFLGRMPWSLLRAWAIAVIAGGQPGVHSGRAWPSMCWLMMDSGAPRQGTAK